MVDASRAGGLAARLPHSTLALVSAWPRPPRGCPTAPGALRSVGAGAFGELTAGPLTPARAGAPRARCKGPRPGRFRTSPGKETPQPFWTACPSALPPSQRSCRSNQRAKCCLPDVSPREAAFCHGTSVPRWEQALKAPEISYSWFSLVCSSSDALPLFLNAPTGLALEGGHRLATLSCKDT